MSSRQNSEQQRNRPQRRKKRNLKNFKKEPPKKIDWKTYIAPGSTKWHEIRMEEKTENEYLSKIRLNREMAENLKEEYLPRLCKKTVLTECPANIVESLGWELCQDTKLFYHNQYGNKPFNLGYCYWNGDKYIVPITNEYDTKGLAYSFKVICGGQICVPYLFSHTDFWKSRRGKRFSKYIEYRKSREQKLNKNPQKD